jgi:hypothetical protein
MSLFVNNVTVSLLYPFFSYTGVNVVDRPHLKVLVLNRYDTVFSVMKYNVIIVGSSGYF